METRETTWKGQNAASGRAGRLRVAAAFVREGVWRADPASLGVLRRTGVLLLRFCLTARASYMRHPCGLHAAGLAYFTVLAFVPVLCLLMVFAKACGAGAFARAEINARLDTMLVQLDEGAEAKRALARQARAASNDLFDRIDTFDVGTLGWLGLGMLLWTVVSTFSQVETSMNAIWGVSRARSAGRRCLLYLFISLVLPLLVAFALSLPVLRGVRIVLDATLGATSYTKWVGDAFVALVTSRTFGFFVSFAFSSASFAFVLKVVPNRAVQTRAALEGGVLTAALFSGVVRACTSAGVGIARSSALYGSFAAVPILLAWIYMSWQVVLLGSCLTYALQCLHCRVRALPRR